MKAKRFVLMLLVMFTSVTGAWAESVTITYAHKRGAGFEDLGQAETWIREQSPDMRNTPDRTSYPIKTMINDLYVEGNKWMESYSHPDGSDFHYLNFAEIWYTAKKITITSLDKHVRIHSVIIKGTSFSASYAQGVEKVTMDINSGGGYTRIENITVEYEWYHEYGETGAAQYTCQYQYEDGHVCGYVDEAKAKELHQHSTTSGWLNDANQHWKVCEETFGICPANGRKIEIGSHEYGTESIEDYCTCKVCGYYSEARYAEIHRDYLSFTAVGAPMTVGMTKTGSPVDYDLQYSSDKLHWSTVNLSATDNNIVEIPDGQTCYFRHGTETAINGINTDGNYWTFTMTGDGTIEAGGNTMSLLDITIQKNNVAAFAFANLFKGCATLTKAPKLPATSTGTRCYKGMFEETGITEAPALPAARVVKGAYENMFKNCLNLETVPELPAIRVDWLGYSEMFNGCKKITEITMGNIETIENGNAFSHWLDGTAYETEGTLIVPDAMVGQVSLPSNWQYKQKRDYIAAVSNATEGTASVIQKIGEDYIAQIKLATSNASAVSLRDEALNIISRLKQYNEKLEPSSFPQPTGAGMRLKVTTKDDKVYEFKTQNVKSLDYYRVNE